MLTPVRTSRGLLAVLTSLSIASTGLFAPSAGAQPVEEPQLQERTLVSDLSKFSSDWALPVLSSDLADNSPRPTETTTPTAPTTSPEVDPDMLDVVPDYDVRRYLNRNYFDRADDEYAPISAAEMATLTTIGAEGNPKNPLEFGTIYIPDSSGRTHRGCGMRCSDPAPLVFPNLEGFQYATNLEYLSVANVSYYPEFHTLPNLKGIQVITEDPRALSDINGTNFPALEVLRLTSKSTEVDHLSGISELTNLKHAEITTRAPRLPHYFSSLSELKELRLTAPFLSYWPEDFGELTALETLHLTQARSLSEFPRSVLDAKNLKVFRFETYSPIDHDRAQIYDIPEEISQLNNLEVLAIFQTSISSLPESLLSMQNLKSVWVEGNRLKNDPVFQELETKGLINNPAYPYPR